MAATIHVLSDALVNKIAAGEVVDRPASVVKELVENSLDAGATDVRVEVRGGGRNLIRVTDNGRGMSPEDARLCLARHATSKLRTDEDLFAIRTLGFRGEALAAISGVSQFSLTTRCAEEAAGTRIDLDGGGAPRLSQVGAPVGTEIEVRELFFNTPARLKFLKGSGLEMGHITEVMTQLALSRPGVAFRLTRLDEVALEVGARSEGIDRITEVLGSQTAEHLYPFAGERLGISARGFASSPFLSRSGWIGFYLFVNGRALRDRLLMKSVAEAYRGILPRGRYPVLVLNVDMPVEEIDVNVHPGKLEARFSRPRLLSDVVIDALRQMLAAAPWRAREGRGSLASPAPLTLLPDREPLRRPAGPSADGELASISRSMWEEARGPRPPAPPPPLAAPSPALSVPRAVAYRVVEAPAPVEGVSSAGGALVGGAPSELPAGPMAPMVAAEAPMPAYEIRPPSPPAGDARPAPVEVGPQPTPHPEPGPPVATAAGEGAHLRALGVVAGRFHLFEHAGGLLLVDAGAARSRGTQRALLEGGRRQVLLIPRVVEIGRREGEMLVAVADVLSELGLDVEPFGGKSFVVKALPVALAEQEPAALLQALAGRLTPELLRVTGPELRGQVAQLLVRLAEPSVDVGPALADWRHELEEVASRGGVEALPWAAQLSQRDMERLFKRS